MPSTLWTIGHSSRPIEAFLSLLRENAIGLVADVRRFPASRAHPQFGGEALRNSLAEAGIDYRHFPDLGGRRGKRLPDSPNRGWRVEAFNAYADHMQSTECLAALADLKALAAERNTAVMCAEALPWQCHRRLIADAFLAAGWSVLDIMSPGKAPPHKLTEFARVEGELVTYPGGTLF
jgi:uncharacterized protein (DUF488 family)